MRTTCWGVVKSVAGGKTFYAPTEFEVEDGQVVKATSYSAGIYEALAYAMLPDIIMGFYRAHLTRKAVGKPKVKIGSTNVGEDTVIDFRKGRPSAKAPGDRK